MALAYLMQFVAFGERQVRRELRTRYAPVVAVLGLALALVVGFLPLVPFAVQFLTPGAIASPYLWSTILTGSAFFGIGAAKGRFVDERWYASGVETLLIGSSAAGLAYLVGVLLKGLGAGGG